MSFFKSPEAQGLRDGLLVGIAVTLMIFAPALGTIRQDNRTILDRLDELRPDTVLVYQQTTVREPAPCVTPPAPADSVCLGSIWDSWDTWVMDPPWPTDEEILQNLHRGVPTVLSVDGDEYTCVTLGRDNRRSTYPCDP